MSAFFGINETNAEGFIASKVVCLPYSSERKLDLHAVVSPIKNEDIVFIKYCTPQFNLHIKAVGIVQSDYASEMGFGTCLPVEWVWQGEKVLENSDESHRLCRETLYEEHDILVQREIIDLLPEKYQMAQV